MGQTAVYRITNTENKSLYFGLSVHPETRFRQHKCAARNGVKGPMYAAMRKHGPHAFVMDVLKVCPDKASADELEIFLIAEGRGFRYPIYNIAIGGQGFGAGEQNPGWGIPFTEERKKRISEARKGKGHAHTEASKSKIAEANRRRVYSEETRRKISEALKGRRPSEENKANISAAIKGLKRSDETRARMSASQKGRVVSKETREKLRQVNIGRKHGPRSEETKAKMRAAWEHRKERKYAL